MVKYSRINWVCFVFLNVLLLGLKWILTYALKLYFHIYLFSSIFNLNQTCEKSMVCMLISNFSPM